MEIINDIYLLSGEKLIKVKKINNRNLFYFENDIILTGKEINRKTSIKIRCSINKQLYVRLYNEQFLYKKIYISPSGSVSGERNGMFGKGYLLKGHEVSEITREKLRIKSTGRKHTEESKRKTSEALKGEKNPFFGKHHTEETKKKLSEARKGKNTGKDNPFWGKKHSEETKIKIVASYLKWREENPEKALEISRKGAMNSMLKQSDNKKSGTERKFENILKSMNIKYIFQYSTIENFLYDFYLLDYNCLIEIQGDYWHGWEGIYNLDGSDGHKKLSENQIKKQISDKRKKTYALNHNYNYLAIWEHDINKNNLTEFMEFIKKFKK